MYASPVHVRILLYVIMTLSQSVVTAIHEYGIYETDGQEESADSD